jgi:hypothetical protein
MALEVDWTIIQSNEAQLSGTILNDVGVALSLTSYSLSLVIKATETSADDTGTTYVPTVVSDYEGTWSQTVPGTEFATAGTMWYRLDVVDGSSNHVTAVFGTITVKAA